MLGEAPRGRLCWACGGSVTAPPLLVRRHRSCRIAAATREGGFDDGTNCETAEQSAGRVLDAALQTLACMAHWRLGDTPIESINFI